MASLVAVGASLVEGPLDSLRKAKSEMKKTERWRLETDQRSGQDLAKQGSLQNLPSFEEPDRRASRGITERSAAATRAKTGIHVHRSKEIRVHINDAVEPSTEAQKYQPLLLHPYSLFRLVAIIAARSSDAIASGSLLWQLLLLLLLVPNEK